MQEFPDYVRGELDRLKREGKEFPGLYEFLALIFYCGFTINELTSMSIGNVTSPGHRKWSPFCQKAIDGYLEEMKSRLGHIPKPYYPLFPEYYGSRGRRKFNRHFGRFEENYFELTHAAIRNEGLFYTELNLPGYVRDDENPRILAEWYGVSERKIEFYYKHFRY